MRHIGLAEAIDERLHLLKFHQDVFDQTRVKVWRQQPADFFDEAVLDVDGTPVATGACCKQGVDIAYDGTWGYHPLIISRANTGEVLSLINRPGNRPSHEGAADGRTW